VSYVFEIFGNEVSAILTSYPQRRVLLISRILTQPLSMSVHPQRDAPFRPAAVLSGAPPVRSVL